LGHFNAISHLEKDVIKLGMETFPFVGISSFKQFEQFTMEEFEEMFKPVWVLYPYRDEGL
jgi:hypothetical protein